MGGSVMRRGSMAALSGAASPRSGLATPTASAAQLMASPGSFFGGTSLTLGGRMGSVPAELSAAANAGAAPLAAAPGSGGLPVTSSVTAPMQRDMSSARLAELVHNPMAGAAAAAGASMAAQEREHFGQLAAEAGGALLAAGAANGLAPAVVSRGTSGLGTPVGSQGGGGGMLPARGLSVVVGQLGGSMARLTSVDLMSAVSPRYSSASGGGAGGGLGTPLASGGVPAAAPLLLADREIIGRRMAHAFPWNPTAQVHVAMALRRREAYLTSSAATIKLQCDWQASSSISTHGALRLGGLTGWPPANPLPLHSLPSFHPSLPPQHCTAQHGAASTSLLQCVGFQG